MIVKTQIKCGSTPTKDLKDRIIKVVNEHAGSLGKVCKISVSRKSNWITVHVDVPEFFKKSTDQINNHMLYVNFFISGILAWEGEDIR